EKHADDAHVDIEEHRRVVGASVGALDDPLPSLPEVVYRGCRILLTLRLQDTQGEAAARGCVLDGGAKVVAFVGAGWLPVQHQCGKKDGARQPKKPDERRWHGCPFAAGRAI